MTTEQTAAPPRLDEIDREGMAARLDEDHFVKRKMGAEIASGKAMIEAAPR